MTLAEERAAFDAQLDALRERSPGKFALVRGGEVVGTFDDFQTAYAKGLDTYGVDETFLIAEIVKAPPSPISLSLSVGVFVE